MLIRKRLSYAFNDLYVMGKSNSTLTLGDHLCKGEVGLLQRELNRAQLLLNSCRTKRMFMAKTNIKVRLENVWKIFMQGMSSST